MPDIKQIELQDKYRHKYFRRVKLVAKTEFYGGNLINVYKCQKINVSVISMTSYVAGLLGWSDNELKTMYVKTRKMWTMF